MTEAFKISEELFLLRHPFYRAWMEGMLSRPNLRDYAGQYYVHVAAFPDYLQKVLNVCSNKDAKAILKDNLAEEDGSKFGISHPELWLRFAEGTGISREEVKAAKPRQAIRNVVETFCTLSQSSYAEALGAIYAYESQVPEIAQSKIEGLKRHFAIADERSLAFFEVHKAADVEHRESLLALIEALPAKQKAEARNAADRACGVLWEFLDDVYAQSACS